MSTPNSTLASRLRDMINGNHNDGLVPTVCDEAANRIDELQSAIHRALSALGRDKPFEAMDILAAVPIGLAPSGGAEPHDGAHAHGKHLASQSSGGAEHGES